MVKARAKRIVGLLITTKNCPTQQSQKCTTTFLMAVAEAPAGDNYNIRKLLLCLCYLLLPLECLPVVPQVTVPVQSNINSESKLYTSTFDLGKLSSLSCSNQNINKYILPCVVSCRPSLLSSTANTYVYHVAEPLVSTPRPIIVSPVAEPPVVTRSA